MPKSLLYQIEKILRLHAIPPSRFGREAANDPQLVFDIKRGRTLGPPLIERISRYMQSIAAKNTKKTQQHPLQRRS